MLPEVNVRKIVCGVGDYMKIVLCLMKVSYTEAS